MEQPAKNIDEYKIFNNLSNRIYETGVYFGLPEWFEIKYEGASRYPLFGEHLRHFGDGIDEFYKSGMIATANHSARIALDSIVLSDMLGIGVGTSFYRQSEFLMDAALNHDTGKTLPGLRDIAEKKVGFTKADQELMKTHVGLAGYVSNEARVIVTDHHRWQKNSYTSVSPAWNWIRKKLGLWHLKRTPETIVLSKFLGILDFHDSAATRVNSRNFDSPRLPSSEELRGLLLQSYGTIKIKYFGLEMSKIDLTGRQLIEDLFEVGVFGRSDPINPYKEPYSFIKRPSKEEALALKEKMKRREEEVREKLKKYNEIELEEYIRNKKE